MDQEIKHILDRQSELLEDNNQILKKLLRAKKWSTFMVALKWVVVIGLSVGVYAILQPILDSLLQTYSGLTSGVGQIKDTGSSLLNASDIFNLLGGE